MTVKNKLELLNKEFTTLKQKINAKLQSQQQTITDTNTKLAESNRQLETALKENGENEKRKINKHSEDLRTDYQNDLKNIYANFLDRPHSLIPIGDITIEDIIEEINGLKEEREFQERQFTLRLVRHARSCEYCPHCQEGGPVIEEVDKKKDFDKYLERIEDPKNNQEVNYDLPENPTPLQVAKFEICQNILAYQQDNNLTDEELATKINLSIPELEEQIDLEIGKIETEIAKLRKEALNEEDPIRRGKIMELIEEQGKNLESKYRKKQELSNKFNFDPGQKVNKLIDAIKKALDKKDRSGNNGGGRGGSGMPSRNPNDDHSDVESSDYLDTDDDNVEPGAKKKKNDFDIEEKAASNNQKEQLQLLLIVGIAGVGYYFFVHLSRKREEAKKEINKLFQQNPSVSSTDLDKEI
ncbi:9241_t:CDS:2 [Cetraspora pellucida]|uniref:9241_t:CDS:1 n=2 Tax=Cetraspora pellucida TaxID=1433469 RepID=A0ACA9K274_9GLOM|nr:9235_t:CDS:2 [Cetraspora pellucida]CAG8447759.1 9241_t:CDS:2 [Cetraspora pellucida]